MSNLHDSNSLGIFETALEEFLLEFIENPYLAYTEHGLHALFFASLFNRLSEEDRYFQFNGKKVCTIQKEYRASNNLGKSRRQNWDIALIDVKGEQSGRYDYMPISAVAEFGLNAGMVHFLDDYLRLSHAETKVNHRYLIHLYRLSGPKNKISSRDWTPKAKDVRELICGHGDGASCEFVDPVEGMKNLIGLMVDISNCAVPNYVLQRFGLVGDGSQVNPVTVLCGVAGECGSGGRILLKAKNGMIETLKI